MWGKGRMMENVRSCWVSAEHGDSTRRAQGGRDLQQWGADPQQTVLLVLLPETVKKAVKKYACFFMAVVPPVSKSTCFCRGHPFNQEGHSYTDVQELQQVLIWTIKHLFVCTNGQGNSRDWDSQPGLYVNSFNQENELMVKYQLDLVRSLTHTPR